MRIPPRVNAVLDWWSRTVWRFAADNPGLTFSAGLFIAAFAMSPFTPPLAWSLGFGAVCMVIGWMSHSPALWLRDDQIRTLLVENERLRRDNAHMLRGHMPADRQETARLPRIGERP